MKINLYIEKEILVCRLKSNLVGYCLIYVVFFLVVCVLLCLLMYDDEEEMRVVCYFGLIEV